MEDNDAALLRSVLEDISDDDLPENEFAGEEIDDYDESDDDTTIANKPSNNNNNKASSSSSYPTTASTTSATSSAKITKTATPNGNTVDLVLDGKLLSLPQKAIDTYTHDDSNNNNAPSSPVPNRVTSDDHDDDLASPIIKRKVSQQNALLQSILAELNDDDTPDYYSYEDVIEQFDEAPKTPSKKAQQQPSAANQCSRSDSLSETDSSGMDSDISGVITEIEDPILKQILNEADVEDDEFAMDAYLDQLKAGKKDSSPAVPPERTAPTQPVPVTPEKPKTSSKQQRGAHHEYNIAKEGTLSTVAETLASATVRKSVGLAKVLKVSKKHIAIGTTYGLILLFDKKQKRKSILGSVSGDGFNDKGCVCSLDFDDANDWLLAGYEKGQIILWDTKGASLLKAVTDAFDTPVNYVSFLPTKTRFMATDSRGIVKSFRISKVLFKYFIDAALVLDGTAGPVIALKVLDKGDSPHPTNMFTLVALATIQQVFVMCIEPEMRVMFKQLRPPHSKTEATAFPYLAWRKVISPFSERHKVTKTKKGIDPVLAVGWGNVIQIIQVHKEGKVTSPEDNTLDFSLVSQLVLEPGASVIGIEWLADRVLGIVDTKQNACIVDPFALKVVEKISVKRLGLEFHRRFTNTPAYHNTIGSHEGYMFMLGVNDIGTLTVLSWTDRIENLVKLGQWENALQLSLDFYQGKAQAAVGLPTEASKLQEIAGGKIAELLLNYIDITLDQGKAIVDGEEREQFFKKLGNTCIEYCLQINRVDLLFGSIFQRFAEGAEMRSIFVHLLEPYIISNRLTVLPKHIIDIIVAHYTERNMLSQLENCILHLDISRMDFDLLIELCRAHHLYRALIYAYNKVMDQYVTPLDEIVRILMLNSSNNPQDPYLMVLLEYLQKCFNGSSFPSGEIPPDRVMPVKREILSYLFSQDKSSKAAVSRARFPKLVVLLRMNTEEFLKVLSVSFDDTSLWKDEEEPISARRRMTDDESGAEEGPQPENTISRQGMVQALLEVMVNTKTDPFSPWETKRRQWPKYEHVGFLFTFLSKYIAQGVIEANSDLIHRIFAHLAFDVALEPTVVEERQKHLVGIIKRYRANEDYNVQKLLSISEKAGFNKVSVFLYTQEQNFVRVIESYLKDPDLKPQVYDYIQTMMSDTSQSPEVHLKVKEATMHHLSTLINMDSGATARVIVEFFGTEHVQVLQKLDPYPELQFEYLKGIVGSKDSSNAGNMGELLERAGIRLGEEVHERYIALLCRFAKDQVYDYLINNDDYRLDYCLELCKKYEIADATSYLLERTGDVSGALKLVLANLNEKMSALKKAIIGRATMEDKLLKKKMQEEQQQQQQGGTSTTASEISTVPEVVPVDLASVDEAKEVQSILDVAIQLCQRNTDRLDDKEVRELWFSLLDMFTKPQRELRYAIEGMKPPAAKKKKMKSPRPRRDDLSDDDDDKVSDSDSDSNNGGHVNDEASLLRRLHELDEMLDDANEKKQELDRKIRESSENAQELRAKLVKVYTLIKNHKARKEELLKQLNAMREAEKQKREDPLAAHNIPRKANLWLQELLNGYVKHILMQMMGYVALPTILNKIVKDHGEDAFGQFKGTILGMLENYGYERMLLRSANHLLADDTFRLGVVLLKKLNHGLRARASNCCYCSRQLLDRETDDDQTVVFTCGHGYHGTCLGDSSFCHICHSSGASSDDAADLEGGASSSHNAVASTVAAPTAPATMAPSNNNNNKKNAAAAKGKKKAGGGGGGGDDDSDQEEMRALKMKMKRLQRLNAKLESTSKLELLMQLERSMIEGDHDGFDEPVLKFDTSLNLVPPNPLKNPDHEEHDVYLMRKATMEPRRPGQHSAESRVTAEIHVDSIFDLAD